MRILVIGAHPDDELLGVGGTIAKHKKNGDEVYIHLLTDGHTSRFRDSNRIGERSEEGDQRINSAHEAASFLEIDELFLSFFPDQRLDTIPMIELIQEIEKISSGIKPDVVYTHHKGDVNFDHQIVFKASMNAFRSVGENFPSKIYSYETISSTEWSAPFPESAFVPNHFVDITEEFEKKITALNFYKNELREFPHPRSEEGLNAAAKKWGSVIGVNFAEAFTIIRDIWK
jgi:LmbE family N-acetylglucosaminyl deacetylase